MLAGAFLFGLATRVVVTLLGDEIAAAINPITHLPRPLRVAAIRATKRRVSVPKKKGPDNGDETVRPKFC
jgi:hypothetical protein